MCERAREGIRGQEFLDSSRVHKSQKSLKKQERLDKIRLPDGYKREYNVGIKDYVIELKTNKQTTKTPAELLLPEHLLLRWK